MNAATATAEELALEMIELDRDARVAVHQLRHESEVFGDRARELRDLVVVLHDRKDQLQEIYRHRFYPAAGRVVAVSGQVMTVSRSGMSVAVRFTDPAGCEHPAHSCSVCGVAAA